MSKTPKFWDYSVALYAKPGIASLCLRLQDDAGCDVNLLLLSCWLGEIGRLPDPAVARNLRAIASEWQRPVIRPVREVRRVLKERFERGAAPPGLGAVRERIKALELDFERLAQEELEVAALASAAAPEGKLTAGRALERLVPKTRQRMKDTQMLLDGAFSSS